MSKILLEVDSKIGTGGWRFAGDWWDSDVEVQWQCWAQVGETWQASCNATNQDRIGLCPRHRRELLEVRDV